MPLDISLLAPGVVVPDVAPLPPLLMPDEPDELLPDVAPEGVVVVVVVVVAESPLVAAGGAALLCAGSSVVVVVVVVCANAAVPISDKKMAIGNFFMLAPYNGLTAD